MREMDIRLWLVEIIISGTRLLKDTAFNVGTGNVSGSIKVDANKLSLK